MKTYLWIIVLLCGCLAEKERVENLAMLKNKIIQEIQKRLDDSKHLCPYKSNSTTIIRTTESLRAGAKFVKNVVVDSMEECVMECCQLKDCNVAVFKDKKKSSCYLFNCGDRHSKCVFAKDANFTVMFPNKLGSSVSSSEQSDKHASDLENLAPPEEKVPPTTTTSTTTTVKPTTKMPTTTTTTTLAPTHRQPVALFGQCGYDKDCGGSSTECLAGYCVCMDGFHAQDGICSPFINTGNKKDQSAGPIMGNKDQSAGQTHGMGDKDQSAGKQLPVLKPTEPEKQPSQPEQPENPNKWPHQGNMGGLPAQPENKQPFNNQGLPTARPSPNKSQQPGGHWPQKPNQGQGHMGPNQRPQHPIQQGQGPVDQGQGRPVDQGQGGGRPGKWRRPGGTRQPNIGRGHTVNRPPPDSHVPKIHNNQKPINIDKGTQKNVLPTKPDTKHSEEKDTKSKDQGKKEGSEPKGNETAKVETAKVEAARHQQEINKEETGKFYSMESNQGAIIALAMGLAVTALLLVFVGCRLRNVKKRLRRGRALHSNEADYLINGMYL